MSLAQAFDLQRLGRVHRCRVARFLPFTTGGFGVATRLLAICGMHTGLSPAQVVAPSPTDSAAREESTSRIEVPFDPRSFERHAGYYQLSSVEFLHAFMDLDGHYFYQVTCCPI